MEERYEPVTKVNNIIMNLYDKVPLSMDNANILYDYIQTGLDRMAEGVLHYDYQNTIDIYIVYLEEKEIMESLTTREAKYLEQYRKIIKAREEKLLGEETLSIETGEIKTLKLLPTEINTTGAVITLVIIEVTMLLGLLLGVIALVKR